MKPSKKVIALLIICVTIIGVVIYVNSHIGSSSADQTAENNETNYQPISVEEGFNSNSDVDSDNDGLKDWEEAMWNTDPHNPDTDGDGTPDGEEVKEGRDPLKKGPNDKLSDENKINIGTTTLAKGFVANSATDNFSKTFFQNYLNAEKDGSLSDNSGSGQDALVQNMVNQAVTSFQTQPHYAKNELTTFGNDPVQTKAYGTSFVLIQQQELAKIATFAKQNDLVSVAKEYKNWSEQLFKLPVPANVADYHLEIINNQYTVYEAYLMLSDYEKDPLKALFEIKEHQRVESEQADLYTHIKNYFTKNGIIFDNSDVANFWASF